MTITCLLVAPKPNCGREVIAMVAYGWRFDVQVGFKQCGQCYAATNPS